MDDQHETSPLPAAIAEWLHGEGLGLDPLAASRLQDLVMSRPTFGEERDRLTGAGQQLSLEEALGLLGGLLSCFDEAESLVTPADAAMMGTVLLCGAWWSVVHRQARAARVLVQHGHRSEAEPNVRVALEHAVLLQVVAAQAAAGRPALMEALVQSAYQQQGRFLVDLGAATGTSRSPDEQGLFEAAQNLLGELRDPEPVDEWGWIRHVQQQCRQLSDGDRLYVWYRMLSTETHAGLGTALPYLSRMLRGETPKREPLAAAFAEHVGLLCWSSVAATRALDQIVGSRVRTEAQNAVLIANGAYELYAE